MECEHDVVVARAGEDGKLAHVISIYFTDRLDNNKELVQFCGGDISGDWGHFPGWIGWCGLELSGAYTLAGLFHVALEGFCGGRMVGFGIFVGGAWPRCVVAGPDGRYQH